MVLKSIVLLSLSIVQLALASTITISSPKANDVWTPGHVVEFAWSLAGDHHHKSGHLNLANSKPGKLSIAIASGPAQSLVIDRVIASNVNATKGSYKWRVPKNFNANKKYVVEIGTSANDIAFAGYISIAKPATNGTAHPTPSHHANPSKTPSASHSSKTHEPSSVCVVVPNSDGIGSTVKCHPKPHKKGGKHGGNQDGNQKQHKEHKHHGHGHHSVKPSHAISTPVNGQVPA
ncbi:hypothetical protein DM01DRAFT_1335280 [Hesseltinella vesiculosa]|uniref:Yeast cell wall synthesis Kre9/Knh1-like N-terminal domain-containing protein n=1 Tax=Hesseltinella vesiculosa TaxID=101127 RepID=A0A1X2GJ04_9FUNG|nr:hypothetical protein DM01DRAFT_1335280 [Hesseltinella vesiculosa]